MGRNIGRLKAPQVICTKGTNPWYVFFQSLVDCSEDRTLLSAGENELGHRATLTPGLLGADID
jgi:hypothetical protein